MKPKDKRKDVPEPMALILGRAEDILALPLPYRKPPTNPEAVHRAASAWAEVDNADPFAYKRMKHYIEQGYERADEIARDARIKLGARKHKVANAA